jgi:hypothetical protein
LNVKMTMVLISGGAAYLHTRAKSKKWVAILGSLSGLSAILAVLFGIQLAG